MTPSLSYKCDTLKIRNVQWGIVLGWLIEISQENLESVWLSTASSGFALKPSGTGGRAAEVKISKHLCIVYLHIKQNLLVHWNQLTVSLNKLILGLCHLVKYKWLSTEVGRKELPVQGHRKAWRQICMEFTHNSLKPALNIAQSHEMKSLF